MTAPTKLTTGYGKPWAERMRKYGVHMSVSRYGRCFNCGMRVGEGSGGHGHLFGPMCYKTDARGPWKYTTTVDAGGRQIDVGTLPADLIAVLAETRAQAGSERRSIWLNLDESGEVTTTNRDEA